MGTRYADVPDLAIYAMPGRSLSTTLTTVAERALQRSSDKATGQLAKRYTMPLTAWGADLRGAVCEMTAWDLLVLKAFDAADQGNVFKTRAESAWKWIVDVSNGIGDLADVVDATPTETEGNRAHIVTSVRRGW